MRGEAFDHGSSGIGLVSGLPFSGASCGLDILCLALM